MSLKNSDRTAVTMADGVLAEEEETERLLTSLGIDSQTDWLTDWLNDWLTDDRLAY